MRFSRYFLWVSAWIKQHKWVAFVLPLLLVWWWSLPRPLFDAPVATVLEDTQGQLLGARIAADGQWRFPLGDSLPDKLAAAVTVFEDKRFHQHWGVDVRAMARAMTQNIRAGHITSGGSTLTMQVIRMARGNPPRTVWQKGIEMLLALRLEATYSKAEILNLWAGHAPFGGNVVGVEAASWRYFGKPLPLLSWAEAATLAVLPNSPALIHPGRNRAALEAKRNRLLRRMRDAGVLDAQTCELAMLESLPDAPIPLPQLVPHLLDQVSAAQGPGRWRVTIDAPLQDRLTKLARQQQQTLAANGIHNIAIVVLDTESGKTLAYVGNIPDLAQEYSPKVDIVQAPRSPGSLLKPLLYSLSLEAGVILPGQLLPDVPTVMGGFRPENFHLAYSGAVPASQALARSLNIPFVHLLKAYGVAPFHDALRKWQFSMLTQPPDHYGLSLILGGCEVSLWQVAGWYSSLGRTLLHYPGYQGQYAPTDWRLPHYLADEVLPEPDLQVHPIGIGGGAAWATLAAMEKVERPNAEGNWEAFASNGRMAWKTGTSFGFRDAWSVGVDPKYTIGIWVGNADGEGRAGLVGITAAAPVLFEVRRLLPSSGGRWFQRPLDDMRQLAICRETGYLAGDVCPVDSLWVPAKGEGGQVCPFHQMVYTDAAQAYRVSRQCAGGAELVAVPWLVLPPLQEYYYRATHPMYRSLPPWRPDCAGDDVDAAMQWIYPTQAGKIKIPRTWDGELSAIVFSAAHRRPGAAVHWHLDGQYLRTTHDNHSIELQPTPGPHELLLLDDAGVRLSRRIVVE